MSSFSYLPGVSQYNYIPDTRPVKVITDTTQRCIKCGTASGKHFVLSHVFIGKDADGQEYVGDIPMPLPDGRYISGKKDSPTFGS